MRFIVWRSFLPPYSECWPEEQPHPSAIWQDGAWCIELDGTVASALAVGKGGDVLGNDCGVILWADASTRGAWERDLPHLPGLEIYDSHRE